MKFFSGSFTIGVLIILILLVQLLVSVYSVIWPWVLRNTTWGKLMTNYAIGLDKIDIARGRSVPAPPYIGGTSATLRRNLKNLSGYKHRIDRIICIFTYYSEILLLFYYVKFFAALI